MVTHLLFLFLQASQGRSLRPRTTLPSIPLFVNLGWEVKESFRREMGGFEEAKGIGTPAGKRGGWYATAVAMVRTDVSGMCASL